MRQWKRLSIGKRTLLLGGTLSIVLLLWLSLPPPKNLTGQFGGESDVPSERAEKCNIYISAMGDLWKKDFSNDSNAPPDLQGGCESFKGTCYEHCTPNNTERTMTLTQLNCGNVDVWVCGAKNNDPPNTVPYCIACACQPQGESCKVQEDCCSSLACTNGSCKGAAQSSSATPPVQSPASSVTGGAAATSSTPSSSTASESVCGNEKIENGEQCDRTNVGGETCVSRLGSTFTGVLRCNIGSCTFDISGCTQIPPCGNGSCSGGESCQSCPQDCGQCPPTPPPPPPPPPPTEKEALHVWCCNPENGTVTEKKAGFFENAKRILGWKKNECKDSGGKPLPVLLNLPPPTEGQTERHVAEARCAKLQPQGDGGAPDVPPGGRVEGETPACSNLDERGNPKDDDGDGLANKEDFGCYPSLCIECFKHEKGKSIEEASTEEWQGYAREKGHAYDPQDPDESSPCENVEGEAVGLLHRFLGFLVAQAPPNPCLPVNINRAVDAWVFLADNNRGPSRGFRPHQLNEYNTTAERLERWMRVWKESVEPFVADTERSRDAANAARNRARNHQLTAESTTNLQTAQNAAQNAQGEKIQAEAAALEARRGAPAPNGAGTRVRERAWEEFQRNAPGRGVDASIQSYPQWHGQYQATRQWINRERAILTQRQLDASNARVRLVEPQNYRFPVLTNADLRDIQRVAPSSHPLTVHSPYRPNSLAQISAQATEWSRSITTASQGVQTEFTTIAAKLDEAIGHFNTAQERLAQVPGIAEEAQNAANTAAEAAEAAQRAVTILKASACCNPRGPSCILLKEFEEGVACSGQLTRAEEIRRGGELAVSAMEERSLATCRTSCGRPSYICGNNAACVEVRRTQQELDDMNRLGIPVFPGTPEGLAQCQEQCSPFYCVNRWVQGSNRTDPPWGWPFCTRYPICRNTALRSGGQNDPRNDPQVSCANARPEALLRPPFAPHTFPRLHRGQLVGLYGELVRNSSETGYASHDACRRQCGRERGQWLAFQGSIDGAIKIQCSTYAHCGGPTCCTTRLNNRCTANARHPWPACANNQQIGCVRQGGPYATEAACRRAHPHAWRPPQQ